MTEASRKNQYNKWLKVCFLRVSLARLKVNVCILKKIDSVGLHCYGVSVESVLGVSLYEFEHGG